MKMMNGYDFYKDKSIFNIRYLARTYACTSYILRNIGFKWIEMDPTIIHFEIPAKNVTNLKTFYEKLFGWKIVKTPSDFMKYWVIQTVPTDDKGMPTRHARAKQSKT